MVLVYLRFMDNAPSEPATGGWNVGEVLVTAGIALAVTVAVLLLVSAFAGRQSQE